MIDILNNFHIYCAIRYSDFKNDLKGHLKKYGELGRLSSILADQWAKYIEYRKDLYVQVFTYLILINTL